MSDDRFKQARRSLMNQQRQQQPSHPPAPGNQPGAASEDATALVDINQLRNGPPPGPHPGGPPPGGAPSYEDEGATQMVDLNALRQGGPPPTPGGASGVSFGATPAGGASPPSGDGLVIGGGGDHEASTQFVDVNAFQQQAPPPSYGPPPEDATEALSLDDIVEEGGPVIADHSTAGYEGSTQFVDLNALAAGGVGEQPGVAQPGGATPQQDPLLQQSYRFTPDAIQQYGDVTLIFAQNQAGQDVVLKRVWDGHPDHMPQDLRVKISQLAQIQHENLAGMNGLFASHSGAWVELERPAGMRLTYLLQRGIMSKEQVAQWAPGVVAALQTIHGFSILYENLTPDAIWLDEQTGQVKIEPFDVLAFEDRGTLGPFGAPELQTPGKFPPTPATDVYSFAVVVLNAITGIPDPGQIDRVEDKKLRKALEEGLKSNPTMRLDEFRTILRALGAKNIPRAGGESEGFDKRFLIPIGILVVLLIALFIPTIMNMVSPPKRVIPPQANVPEMPPEDRVPQTNAPGVLEEDERLTVLTSYIYAPPETPKEPKLPSEEEIEGFIEASREALSASKKYKDSNNTDYQNALENYAKAVRGRGGTPTEAEDELFEELMEHHKLREYYNEKLKGVEESLIEEQSVGSATLRYRTLTLIDPNANALRFFENNAKATVREISRKEAGGDAAPAEEDKEKEE